MRTKGIGMGGWCGGFDIQVQMILQDVFTAAMQCWAGALVPSENPRIYAFQKQPVFVAIVPDAVNPRLSKYSITCFSFTS